MGPRGANWGLETEELIGFPLPALWQLNSRHASQPGSFLTRGCCADGSLPTTWRKGVPGPEVGGLHYILSRQGLGLCQVEPGFASHTQFPAELDSHLLYQM